MLFEQYLTELKNIRLLSPMEEQTLWQAYKTQGNLESRRRLIEQYQPLVFKIVMRWRSNPYAVMDLIQEGTVGLIEAIEAYQPERGVAFSLFATHRIRGRVLTFLEKEGKTKWISIESPAESGGDALSDLLVDGAEPVAEQAERNYLLDHLRTAMERLPAQELAVINGVYMEERHTRELADKLNLSQSHIYRLQKQGIRRIRGMLSRLMHEFK